MRRARSARSRRALAAALLLLILAAVLEGASYLLWWASEGSPFTDSAASRLAAEAMEGERRTAERRTAWAEGRERWSAATAAAAPFIMNESLHPFLGFVVDPDINLLPEKPFPLLVATPQGFLAYEDDLRRPPSTSEPLRVAMFGGSVAQILSLSGRAALERGLAAGGVVPEGGVEVVSRALGGWKQPQPLMALSWLLAAGERYDAIVLLDGFNDLVLPVTENRPADVNPFYPRGWRHRVRGISDAELEERVGELAFLRRRRAERARRFLASPWRRTVVGGLVWRSLDRRAAARVAAAETAVAEWTPSRRRPFFTRGPELSFADRDDLYRALAAFWARSSRQMRDLARGRDMAYVHFLQPNQYVPDAKPLSYEERRSAFDPDHPYRRVVEGGWRHLRRDGEDLLSAGVRFHDLTDLFAGEHDTLYIDDCCHLNPRGNELLGEAVGRALALELRRTRAAEAGGETAISSR